MAPCDQGKQPFRHVRDEEVAGSNPVTPTSNGNGSSPVGGGPFSHVSWDATPAPSSLFATVSFRVPVVLCRLIAAHAPEMPPAFRPRFGVTAG
jgi:hypothetical protein